MRKLLFIALGWTVLVGGVLVSPLPLPLPFPVGAVLILIGCAILTTHSKPFRRLLQYARHRYHWLDRSIQFFGKRSPQSVKVMVSRTQPMAIKRRMRLRGRAGGIPD